MNLTKFDFSKLFDLNILVIESDPSSGHQLKQILTGLGIKKVELARSALPVLNSEGIAPYDIVFLDYDAEPSIAGADLIELLLHKQILSPLCRLVVLSAATERQKHAVDYPFYQLDFLDRPCNKFHIDEQLKLHVRLKPYMDLVLPLIHKRRYVDAFKLITELQQKAGADAPAILLQLKAHILLELGVCEAATALIKPACVKQQEWALWLQFLLDYEQGDLDAVQHFLGSNNEELQRYQERKEVWQIFLALDNEDYAAALAVATKIPAAGMSTQIAQLVQLVMMMSDKVEPAIEFIERKRRLLGSGYQYCALTISLSKLLNKAMQQETSESRVTQYQNLLQQSFRQLITDKEASQFAADIIWLQATLVRQAEGEDAAIAFLEKQKQHLATMQMSVASLCQGAALMASLGKMHAAFDLLFMGDKALNLLPHTMHKVYANCVHQLTLHGIYAPEHRGQVYAHMGQRHEKEGDLRPAARMYYKAYLAEPGQLKYQEQLASLLRQLKLNKFKTFVTDEVLG